MRLKRTLGGTAIAAIASTALLTLGATPASAQCVPDDPYYDFSGSSQVWLRTDLASDYMHAAAGESRTITYTKTSTATVTASVTATVTAEAGAVFVKASASLGVTVGFSYAWTDGFSYAATFTAPSNAPRTARLALMKRARQFTVTKYAFHTGQCKDIVAYSSTVIAPEKEGVQAWALDDAPSSSLRSASSSLPTGYRQLRTDTRGNRYLDSRDAIGAAENPPPTPVGGIAVKRNDYNRDGISDIVAVRDDCLHRWYGTGNGGFSYGGTVGCGWSPYAASLTAVGDINRDGVGDLVAVSGDALHRWYGTGGGGFTYAGTYGDGWTPYASSLTGMGDINKDGISDVLAVSGDALHRWYGTGSGGYTYAGTYGSGWTPYPIR